ncbi:MAG TPA: TROVE domain-containing protein [Candidatus Saccharimonadales bacterium]|jgi:60 kDa SS-A/Ro ribonucleoprotein|nr:TROVE domain-containing protein [Candidatus Saccharimonadales bacterium]
MARINTLNLGASHRTHEGASARHVAAELQLRRAVLACMLWEDQFYEEGVAIAGRIRELVAKTPAEQVAALAVEAREKMKLRHAPLLLVREMARLKTHRHLVAETLARVIQRADELSEFVALYWAEGKQPLSAQVKKGLASAFTRFDEYALAKYNRAAPVKLRDVLFLSHAKPLDQAQAQLWKRLAEGELTTPDTWEVALSAGADKREVWERLLSENKLGALALLRNLRNMAEAKVPEPLIQAGLERMKTERVLPFRFIAAARYAPQWEPELEKAMLKSLQGAGQAKLPGKTVLLVDVSGSMDAPLSRRAEMRRNDAAYGLAILLREIAERVSVYSFSDQLVRVPDRSGFALRDAINASQPHGSTYLGRALEQLQEGQIEEEYDRLIVITDEQSHDEVANPRARGYVINVASYKNGVGYGKWVHIDGWSEAVIEYIRAAEPILGQ